MKNLVALMMVFCCSIGLGMAQLNPMSSVGYATEAPPGYCLSVEEYFVHDPNAERTRWSYDLPSVPELCE